MCVYCAATKWSPRNSVLHLYVPPLCVLNFVHTSVRVYEKCILLKKIINTGVQSEWYTTQHYCWL